MTTTRGSVSRRRQFSWTYDSQTKSLVAINDRHRALSYDIENVLEILSSLEAQFGDDFFLLANNVALLGRGEEKPGLATTILQSYQGDITRAQGASYLGVILEELGYLEWNKKTYGIAWRLLPREIDRSVLLERLSHRGFKLPRGTKKTYVENLFETS